MTPDERFGVFRLGLPSRSAAVLVNASATLSINILTRKRLCTSTDNDPDTDG